MTVRIVNNIQCDTEDECIWAADILSFEIKRIWKDADVYSGNPHARGRGRRKYWHVTVEAFIPIDGVEV